MTDALSRLEQLDDDELDALVDIAQARASGAVSRRDLLKTGGALTALGLGGGAAVGSASADASTSDGDGNVGRPSDRYDGFFDGVDANSVSVDEANIGTSTTGVTGVGQIGECGIIKTADSITVADDASETLISSFGPGDHVAWVLINNNDGESAIVNASGAGASFSITGGDWSTSDTDGNNCVFRDGDTNLVVKNRTGVARDYNLVLIGLDPA